jgi:hypothetical protein
MNFSELMSDPNTDNMSEMFGKLGEPDEADTEEGIAVLFEAALDPSTGILVPALVNEWEDLLASEGATMEELVGPEMAWVLRLFAVGYCKPGRQTVLAFGHPEQIRRSREFPTAQVKQTLRILARALRLGRQHTAQKILGGISAGADSLKRTIGARASVRSVRAYDLAHEEQLRLGLVWNGGHR